MKVEREVQEKACAKCGYEHNAVDAPACGWCSRPLSFAARIVIRKADLELEPASFMRRSMAYILDGLVLAVVFVPVILASDGVFYYVLANLAGISLTLPGSGC